MNVNWQPILGQSASSALHKADEARPWLPEAHVSIFEYFAVWAAIVGLPLALWGIWKAYKEAQKAQTASRAAQDAVGQFRSDLGKVNVIAELTRFCDGISDLKRFLRAKVVHVVPDRLSELRRYLINARQSHLFTGNNKAQKVIQAAVTELATTEDSIEAHLADTKQPLDFVKITREMTRICDEIHVLLNDARTTIGKNDKD